MCFMHLTPILPFPLTVGRNQSNAKVSVPSPLRGRVRMAVEALMNFPG